MFLCGPLDPNTMRDRLAIMVALLGSVLLVNPALIRPAPDRGTELAVADTKLYTTYTHPHFDIQFITRGR